MQSIIFCFDQKRQLAVLEISYKYLNDKWEPWDEKYMLCYQLYCLLLSFYASSMHVCDVWTLGCHELFRLRLMDGQATERNNTTTWFCCSRIQISGTMHYRVKGRLFVFHIAILLLFSSKLVYVICFWFVADKCRTIFHFRACPKRIKCFGCKYCWSLQHLKLSLKSWNFRGSKWM